MARNEEQRRVRERLGVLAGDPAGTRSVPGGRWDLDEFGAEERGPERSAADDWGETVEGPRTPQWLSEPSGGLSTWHERLVPERFRGTRLDPGRRGVLVLAVAGVVAVIVAGAAAQRERPVAQPVPPLPAVRTSAVSATGAAAELDALPTAGAIGAVAPAPDSQGTDSGAATPASPGTRGADAGAATSVPTRGAELVVSVIGLVEHPGLLRLPPGARVADALSAAATRDGADLASLNLAQRLADGDQVVVGPAGSHPGPPQLGSVVIPGTRQSPTPGSSGAPPPSPTAKVDLNSATESELDALPGVGPTTARAILAWRTEHGRFTSVDQLSEVTGIGPSRLARIRDLVTV
ncbi:ComEA family DNA-binding protein [Nocardia wallacei]|uniref:ComEA family DNA-binding protein n=1 Tax=Nocardia wallacei TaxID=480035 RepID=UPI002454F893|nr:helix-hairpin-helix domain-containing protein [Nocardia wallacei]